ncbi:hypothetical protein KFZ70_06070 [Tamlana fucoidanivorans]|uniref:Fucose isomerase n=1 Tax=Allotamlana fucoidanivorans TaxID=2583814 RepID=A0A5C4SNV2_9FLAO|nr:fucose isomerase [Tamlana fucoidanivorans]TNJ45421.1 fucose isomerase [Tamlana fucoidanivorans]
MLADILNTQHVNHFSSGDTSKTDFSERQGIVAHEMEQLISYKPKSKPVKIGLIGIGLEMHFDWELAKKSYKQALNKCQDIVGSTTLLAPETPLQTKDELLKALNSYKKHELAGIIIYQASYISGDLALALGNWLRVHKTPLLSWSHDEVTGGRLTANRLCGQNFLLNILNTLEVKYSWVFGTAQSKELNNALSQFLRVVIAKKKLEHSKLLMIGGMRVPGFYDCELNELSISKHFGIGIERIDLETIWKHAEKFEDGDIEPIVYKLIHNEKCHDSQVSKRELMLSVRLSLAIADYARLENYAGVALKNWPELFDNYQISGDGAGALVQDLGIPVADESDMGGLITMVIMNEISNGKALPTLMDMSILDHKNNTLGMWHCGGSPTRLLRTNSTYEVRNHSILDNFDEAQSYGMLLEFLLEKGPVTIAKYQYPHASSMLSFEGDIIDSPLQFRGAYGEVKTKNIQASAVVSTILNNGLDHHWIVGRGHFQEDLKEFNHWTEVNDLDFSEAKLYGRSIQKNLNY